MRQAVLLGNTDTKRTNYFRQAAAQAKLPVLFVDWKDLEQWKKQLPQAEWFLKIDPPLWDSFSLGKLDQLTNAYKEELYRMSRLARTYSLEFLNHPLTIIELLDKRLCKKKLEQAGLAVTTMLEEERFSDGADRAAEHLLQLMRQKEVYQVFIKPVNGSGAAGVSAFRWQPMTGRMVLYTCAWEHPEYGLVNTKRLRRFENRDEVFSLLNQILKMDCVIERWYAKAECEGYSYDLRVIVLDGKIEFLLGRLSKGPITNLHLNNHPKEAAALGIPKPVLEEMAVICKRAMDCFPGLRSAGIDILLEKGSMHPRIIEMNAQGDLIYQDIFHENKIYLRQAEMIREWMPAGSIEQVI